MLFLKRETPSIELCRVTRGTTGSPPNLRVVQTLALPPFHATYRVHTAYMQTDRHSERRRAAAPQRPVPPIPFHSAPDDRVVGITFLLRRVGPQTVWKKAVTTISHRALFALAGCEGGGADVVVPWEEWGFHAARVIAPSSFQWITAHAGQRWLSLESGGLVIRDFSAVRVRRAAGAGVNAVDIRIAPPPDSEMIRAGLSCFAHDVTSALPFVETCVDAPGKEFSMVLTDGERLVAFVRSVSQR